MIGSFETGPIVVTTGIDRLMHDRPSSAEYIKRCIDRYLKGDWGEMVYSDKQINDPALEAEF